jgi:hypothetical protein
MYTLQESEEVDIWKALEHTGKKSFVESLVDKVDTLVIQG